MNLDQAEKMDVTLNMRKQEITPTKKESYIKELYFCPKCGPFTRVILEHWLLGDDGPTYIDFIHHVDMQAHVADRLQLRPLREGQFESYSYCGDCRTILNAKPEKHPQWG